LITIGTHLTALEIPEQIRMKSHHSQNSEVEVFRSASMLQVILGAGTNYEKKERC
jgi:hypothetical protein